MICGRARRRSCRIRGLGGSAWSGGPGRTFKVWRTRCPRFTLKAPKPEFFGRPRQSKRCFVRTRHARPDEAEHRRGGAAKGTRRRACARLGPGPLNIPQPGQDLVPGLQGSALPWNRRREPPPRADRRAAASRPTARCPPGKPAGARTKACGYRVAVRKAVLRGPGPKVGGRHAAGTPGPCLRNGFRRSSAPLRRRRRQVGQFLLQQADELFQAPLLPSRRRPLLEGRSGAPSRVRGGVALLVGRHAAPGPPARHEEHRVPRQGLGAPGGRGIPVRRWSARGRSAAGVKSSPWTSTKRTSPWKPWAAPGSAPPARAVPRGPPGGRSPGGPGGSPRHLRFKSRQGVRTDPGGVELDVRDSGGRRRWPGVELGTAGAGAGRCAAACGRSAYPSPGAGWLAREKRPGQVVARFPFPFCTSSTARLSRNPWSGGWPPPSGNRTQSSRTRRAAALPRGTAPVLQAGQVRVLFESGDRVHGRSLPPLSRQPGAEVEHARRCGPTRWSWPAPGIPFPRTHVARRWMI